MTQVTINLGTTDGVSQAISVQEFTRLSVSIVLRSGESWGTAVVTLQKSSELGVDDQGQTVENWVNTTFTFSTSTTFPVVDIPVADSGWIRLATTTANSAGDNAANANLRLAG